MSFGLGDLAEVALCCEAEVDPNQSERRPRFLVDPDTEKPTPRSWFALTWASTPPRRRRARHLGCVHRLDLGRHELAHMGEQRAPPLDCCPSKHGPRGIVHLDSHRSTISGTVRATTKSFGPPTLKLESAFGGTGLLLGLGPLLLSPGDASQQLTLSIQKSLHMRCLLALGIGSILQIDQILGCVDEVEIEAILAVTLALRLQLSGLWRWLPRPIPAHLTHPWS